MPLYVKLLTKDAKTPTVAYPGEDLGFDLYASEDVNVTSMMTPVKTGIAMRYVNGERPFGLIIKDRSSMAFKGVTTHAGVIDSTFSGEIVVLMKSVHPYFIKKGDKIAQAVATPVYTDSVFVVDEIGEGNRGNKGFGSTGKN